MAAPSANGHAPRLVGPDGRPLVTDRGMLLPHHQTFTAVYNAHQRLYRYTYDEAIRQDPQKALAMRRDVFLSALFQERVLATVGLPWRIEGENPKDPRQKLVCEQVTSVVKACPYFSTLRYYLLRYRVWYGRGGAQIRWGTKSVAGRQLPCVPLAHLPVNGDKIVFDYDGNPLVAVNATWANTLKDRAPDEHRRLIADPATARTVYGDRMPLLRLSDPRWRQRFVIARHVPEDKDYFDAEAAGAVGGLGLRDELFWAWELRAEFLSWLADYMQKVGANGLMVFPYQDGNDASKQAAEAAAKASNDKTAFTLPVPPGADAKSLAPFNIPASVEGVQYLQTVISDYFERHMERLVVGQSMSSGSDGENSLGGSGRANFARDTKFQITKFDAELEAECLTQDLVGPILRYDFPGTPFPVYFKTDVPDPERDQKVESAKVLFDMGVDIKTDELREACGYSKPEEDDEVVGLAGEEVMVGGDGPGPGGPAGGPPQGGGGDGPPRGGRPAPGGRPEAPPAEHYAADWDESEHPRDEEGQFAEQPGGGRPASRAERKARRVARRQALAADRRERTAGRAPATVEGARAAARQAGPMAEALAGKIGDLYAQAAAAHSSAGASGVRGAAAHRKAAKEALRPLAAAAVAPALKKVADAPAFQDAKPGLVGAIQAEVSRAAQAAADRLATLAADASEAAAEALKEKGPGRRKALLDGLREALGRGAEGWRLELEDAVEEHLGDDSEAFARIADEVMPRHGWPQKLTDDDEEEEQDRVSGQQAAFARLVLAEAREALLPWQRPGAGGPVAYAADEAEGRWVTMGAQGPEGDKHGGTPVYIVGGKIAKGPQKFVGKAVAQLRKSTAAEQATQGPTLHPPGSPEKDAVVAQRQAAGLPPHHPQDAPEGGMPLVAPGQPTRGPLPPSAPPGTPTGPTSAALGSPERMAAMRAREAAGLPVHDAGDRPGAPPNVAQPDFVADTARRLEGATGPSLDDRMAQVRQPEARRDPTIGELAQGPDVGREPGVGKPGAPGRFGHPEPEGKGGTVPAAAKAAQVATQNAPISADMSSKKPHELTYGEFRKQHPATRGFERQPAEVRVGSRALDPNIERRNQQGESVYTHPMRPNSAFRSAAQATKAAHRAAVAAALAAGHSVSPEILADYPDLVAKQQPRPDLMDPAGVQNRPAGRLSAGLSAILGPAQPPPGQPPAPAAPDPATQKAIDALKAQGFSVTPIPPGGTPQPAPKPAAPPKPVDRRAQLERDVARLQQSIAEGLHSNREDVQDGVREDQRRLAALRAELARLSPPAPR